MLSARRLTLYECLLSLPERLIGEIINGQIHTQPRPTAAHALVASRLGADLEPPFGRGGPGGWWIIDEPEIHFIRDTEVVVPDIAGWRRTRMPEIPEDQRFEVVPDWICEILSPSTRSTDREIKMPLYARYEVAFAWIVDPVEKTLEAYALSDGKWGTIGQYHGDDEVCTVPFAEVSIALGEIW